MSENKIEGLSKTKIAACSTIHTCNQIGDSIYLILEGDIALISKGDRGRSRVVCILGADDVFGEELLSVGKYEYTARSVTSVKLIKMTPMALLTLMAKEQSFARSIILRFTRRFHKVVQESIIKSADLEEASGALERLQASLGNRDATLQDKNVEIETLQEFLESMIHTGIQGLQPAPIPVSGSEVLAQSQISGNDD